MIPEPKNLTSTTPEDDYPENLVAVAQRFFRWLCERENEQLALRRFDDRALKEKIENHAIMTEPLAMDLRRPVEERGLLAWTNFSQFCEHENVDIEEFKESRITLKDLLVRALLQFHLAYHDFHSGGSNPTFQFPMFKEVWLQARSEDIPLYEYASPEERRPPGRPGIDYEWMKKRLRELEGAEELPALGGPWKTELAELLLQEYMNNYDGIKLRKPPKMTTIRDKMRFEFDELKARNEQRYDTR